MPANRMRGRSYFNMLWDLHKFKTLRNRVDALLVDTVIALTGDADGAAPCDGVSVVAVAPSGVDSPQIKGLRRWSERHTIRLMESAGDDLFHVLLRERIARPGTTVICDDPRAGTLGAFGVLALYVGAASQRSAMETGCIITERPPVMRVELKGELRKDASTLDLGLYVLSRIGANGGLGFAIEFGGPLLRRLDTEQRLTLCDMAADTGAITTIIPPDEAVHALHASTHDRLVRVDAENVLPLITWGMHPSDSVPLSGRIPRRAPEHALQYMQLERGQRIARLRIDRVYIGSPTMRLRDLRLAASFLNRRTVRVPTVVAPGSVALRREAEKENLPQLFRAAGAVWTDDAAGWPQRGGVPSSFETHDLRFICTAASMPVRRTDGARMHLTSPAVAAAGAVLGRIPTLEEFRSLEAGDVRPASGLPPML